MKTNGDVFAVFKTGGKQYKVKKGDILEVEKIDGEEGSEITFSDVFLVVDKKSVRIGTPFVPHVKIKAGIIGQVKGEKIKVFKYRPKKRYRRTKGHRQLYTRIKILDIG